MEAFSKEHDAVMVGLFQEGDTDFIEFEKAATRMSIPVGYTADPDLAQQYTGSKVTIGTAITAAVGAEGLCCAVDCVGSFSNCDR